MLPSRIEASSSEGQQESNHGFWRPFLLQGRVLGQTDRRQRKNREGESACPGDPRCAWVLGPLWTDSSAAAGKHGRFCRPSFEVPRELWGTPAGDGAGMPNARVPRVSVHVCAGRGPGEEQLWAGADRSPSPTPVSLDFRVGFKFGSHITEGKKPNQQTQETFSLKDEEILEFRWHPAKIELLTSSLDSSRKGIVFLPKTIDLSVN